MAHAIRFEKTGGPEVLTWQAVEVGKPGQGQVRLRHTAVGLNYIDTYHRSGLYQLPMPSGLGIAATNLPNASASRPQISAEIAPPSPGATRNRPGLAGVVPGSA